MYFGSVRFFKHLILTVVALLIIVPTVMCIVLLCDNNNKANEIERLNSIIAQGEYSDSDNSSATESSDISSSEPSVTEEKPESSKPESQSDTTTSAVSTPAPGSGTSAAGSETSAPESQTTTTTSDQTPEESSSPDSSLPNDSESDSNTSEDSDSSQTPDSVDLSTLYTDMYVVPYEGEYISDDNTVYLTFDDGPSILTENLLYYLRQEGVTATFFIVPQDTDYFRQMLRRIIDEGHTIGIHTASHDYEKIYDSPQAFLDDFYEAYSFVYEVTGVKCDIFRFAGGSINDYNEDTIDEIVAEMTRRGFTYFDWNVDSNDWQGLGWTALYNNVVADACEFSTPVILFHDTGDRENTVLVLEDIIKALKNKGYKFGSLSNKIEPVQFY